MHCNRNLSCWQLYLSPKYKFANVKKLLMMWFCGWIIVPCDIGSYEQLQSWIHMMSVVVIIFCFFVIKNWLIWLYYWSDYFKFWSIIACMDMGCKCGPLTELYIMDLVYWQVIVGDNVIKVDIKCLISSDYLSLFVWFFFIIWLIFACAWDTGWPLTELWTRWIVEW